MSTKSIKVQDFQPEKKRVDLSVGESVRSVRKLQNMSQAQLANATGLTVAALHAIENNHRPPDLEQAKALARALNVHPAVIAFPGWV